MNMVAKLASLPTLAAFFHGMVSFFTCPKRYLRVMCPCGKRDSKVYSRDDGERRKLEWRHCQTTRQYILGEKVGTVKGGVDEAAHGLAAW